MQRPWVISLTIALIAAGIFTFWWSPSTNLKIHQSDTENKELEEISYDYPQIALPELTKKANLQDIVIVTDGVIAQEIGPGLYSFQLSPSFATGEGQLSATRFVGDIEQLQQVLAQL